MIMTGIVLFGAIHYGAMIFDYNLAEYLNLVFFRIFRKRGVVDKVIYALFAICAIILAFDRTTWLPFLGNGRCSFSIWSASAILAPARLMVCGAF